MSTKNLKNVKEYSEAYFYFENELANNNITLKEFIDIIKNLKKQFKIN